MQIVIRSNVIYIVIIMTNSHDKYATDRQYYRQSVMPWCRLLLLSDFYELNSCQCQWNETSKVTLV